MSNSVPPRRATLSDVAAQAGVSRATVSLVLRDSPLVAEPTRARVRAAAERVGYLYNRGAATMRGTRTKTVGLVVTEIDNPFFAEMAAGVEAALDQAGYIAFLAATRDAPDRQDRALRRLREHRVDGIILCPALGTQVAEIATLAAHGVPCVQAMRRVPGSGGDFTAPANRAGMQALALHLIAAGRRRFAFAGAGVMHSGVRERLAGLRDALRRHRLPPPTLLRTPGTRAGGAATARLLAALPERPDALVCSNDVMAFGAIAALEQAGWRVGSEVAVTGVGDVPEAATYRPALTTLRTGPRQIGEAAVRLLLRRIADPGAPAERLVMPAELVVRASCGGGRRSA
ncbi:LacI family DNA-binding transcriptional regulator [Teichococcus oryzae]|uniref:Substrate-binding domain-containing protein n=1 Tax=Teichococcus oryzae TaxID=1608942 RepID=A0A5B2TD62_9PROT|nr:LacI family DNA-binding transcriptional regulator [Pseudoroseomonas oryzae]KAA2212014.1 substrate-binding domain-containing protein [Pseudoroseomonas oryzae]